MKKNEMKITLTRIASTLIVCLLLWVCISGLGFIVRPTDTDGAYSQVETFHSLPKNSIEVMIYGSSHAYRGVSTMKMYDEYGIGAYNYGWHWQKANTTNLFLKDSLEKQTPRVVLIEACLLSSVLKNTNITAEIYYTRYLHNNSAKMDYLKQCFGTDIERYLSFFMPLCAFHDNWNTLTSTSFTSLSVNPGLRRSMGFSMSNAVKEVEIPDYRRFVQKEYTRDAENEILDMIHTCHEKGIQVVFFTVPWEGEFAYGNAIRKLAKENDCAYLDLFESMEEIGIDGKTDFSDSGHLNTSGAEKVAVYLGKYIVENYDVTDMRTIENNLWTMAKQQ